MAEGIKKNEPDARIVYADIIDLPRHQSPTRKHMSLYDRSAQFAPFAALTGYDEMIDEEARLVDDKIELDETSLEILNQKLTLISDVIADGQRPALTITYFVPDPLKDGGKYVTIREKIKRIDTVTGKVILDKQIGYAAMDMEISIADILEITGELVDYMDEGIL